MKLLNLELENWTCHERLDVNLSEGLQIEGRNGVGKSSILEAIRFIFAKDARRYNGKIRNGKKTATVRLKFSRDGNLYLIEKNLHLNKSSTASLAINGNLAADNPTSVYNSLQDCLNERILDRLLYVPQGGLTEFIDRLNLKGGRQELDSLIGLDRFDLVYDGAGKEFLVKKTRYENYRDEFRRYPEGLEENSGRKVKELNSEMGELKERVRIKERVLKGMLERIQYLDGEIGRIQRQGRRREELNRRINELRVEITRREGEVSALRKELEQIREKKMRKDVLLDKEKNGERYETIRKTLLELKGNEGRLVDKGEIERDRKMLENLKETLMKKNETERKLRDSGDRIMELERSLAAYRQKRRESVEYLRGLEELNEGVKCPRCGRPLTEKHLTIEKKVTRDEIAATDIEITSVEKELEKHLRDKKLLEKNLDIMKKNEAEAEFLEKDISSREKGNERILDRINELRDKLQGSSYSGESMDEVELRIAELNSIRGELRILEKEISREKEYDNRLRSDHKENNELKDELKRVEAEFTGLEFNPDASNLMQEERNSLNDARHKLERERDKWEFRIKEITGELDEINRKMMEFTGLKERLEKARREMRLFKEARDEVFHPNRGIRRYYRELYMKRLSTLLTYYFRRLNQNPRYRDVRFDTDYRILIRSNEGELKIEQLSGGERVQLALALRISLIELLSPVRMLILDEPFGSLDIEHREILGEALNRIARDGQLIIVTHIHVESLNLPERLELGGY